MSVANLTRYVIHFKHIGDDYETNAVVSKSGDWVEFKEAVEASLNSTQQLKAEISLGVGSIARDSSIPAVDRLDRIVMFVNEKLSAV